MGIHNCMSSGIALAVSLLLSTGAATAQDAPADASVDEARVSPGEGDVYTDIVVTAQRRSESVQSVPLSIVALDTASLRAAGVDDVLEVTKMVPSFTSTRQTSPSGVRLNIRGVGATTQTSVEPSVASFVDDVYVPRPGSIVGKFFDLAGIEVLRGPQGTLFGRNASVGALSIKTQKPTDDLEGYVEGQVASFNSYEATGALNVPLGDTFAIRAAGIFATTDGPWFSRRTNARYGALDTYAGRLSMRFQPTDTIEWIVRGDYMKNTGDASAHNTVITNTVTPAARVNFFNRLGGIAPDFDNQFSRTSNNFVAGDLDDRQYGVNSDFNLDFGGGYSLRLINAYRDWRSRHQIGDLAFTPRQIFLRDETQASESTSHELQIASPTDALLDGRLSFVTGLYYFHEKLTFAERFNFTNDTCDYAVRLAAPALYGACIAGVRANALANAFDQRLDSYAAYLQTDVKLLPNVTLTLGGRYTHERKSGSFVQLANNPAGVILRAPENVSLSRRDGRFTYRANLSYKPTPDIMIFANHSTGFKSGGFNSGGGTPALNQRRSFGPESVDDYEFGFKSMFLNRALTFNLTAFQMDIHNFQDRSYDGTSFIVRNAAELRQRGVEGELVLRPSRSFRFNAAVSYLDSEFRSYPGASGLPGFGGTQDLTGKRNNFSPEWQGSVGAQWDRELTASGFNMSLRSDISFVSDQSVSSVTDGNPAAIQDGYALLSARLTLNAPGDRYSLQIFGENLTNKGYCSFNFPNTLDGVFGLRNPANGGTLLRCQVGMPRQIGARLSARF